MSPSELTSTLPCRLVIREPFKSIRAHRRAAIAELRHTSERTVRQQAQRQAFGELLMVFGLGESFEGAIAHAGRIRLRPILMTTFCTLFGLLPLALGLGAGAELQKPLALAVIGGLALSTPATLLVVPGLYAAIKPGRR